jgi:uncharacterized protein YkwD
VRRLLWIPVLCLALAGCGGAKKSSSARLDARTEIGAAQFATNAPARAGTKINNQMTNGSVALGEPVFDATSTPPPVGLGSRQATCVGTNLEPSAVNMRYTRRATLCLVNAERRARGLRPLRANARLARASLGHAKDMVVRSYFSHFSLSGENFVVRIRRSGYFRGTGSWTVGENLAWGVGPAATPSQIVQAWMASPAHKANILNGRFRELGIGIALGVPIQGGGAGATYDTGFGAHF